MQKTADGGYVIAGETRSFGAGDSDVYLIKTDAQGDTLWTRTYGGARRDDGNSVIQAADGGYVIAGTTWSFGADVDVYLIRTNASGDTLWTRTYGGSWQTDYYGYSVTQTTDSGYMIAGNLYIGAGLIKTDAKGGTLWTRTYSLVENDAGYSVQQTTDGGYVVAGITHAYTYGPSNVYLIKTDAQGDTLWTRAYGHGGLSSSAGTHVQQTTDGGYIVSGFTHPFGAVKSDVYLVKTDAQGDTLWTRTYGGTGDDEGNSVQQTPDGGYIVAGYTGSSGAGDDDIWLIKTNALGDTIWTRTYGGAQGDEGYSVQLTLDGGYAVLGTGMSFGLGAPDSANIYLIKTNGDLDVGPVAILSPSESVKYGTACVPRVVVRNLGLTSGIFPVTMEIGSGYSQTVQETLVSVPEETLAFTAWTAGPLGPLAVTCFTSLPGDSNPTNDTIRDSIRVVGPGSDDVGAVTILSPPGMADSGSVCVPRATVHNFGQVAAIFPLVMDIGTGYSRTEQETLASGLTDTVSFPPWTAGPKGSLAVVCFTSLVGDENPTNDTIRGSIRVVAPPRHDVGAVAILSPPGILRAGDTVMPKVRIKNFGNTAERLFDVQFRISTGYSRTMTVTQALSPDSTMDLTFSEWVAAPGQWAVSCSTMLANDVNRGNDKVSSSVQTFPQSLRIGPDQSDQLQAGQDKTYRFYALVQGDTGGIVELKMGTVPARGQAHGASQGPRRASVPGAAGGTVPIFTSAPPGWSLRLCNATGANDLTDTDKDGIPDLGYVAPGESCWFSLDVTTPAGLVGDTASLAQRTFLIAGHMGNDSLVADTAVLNLTLVPAFSVHNFPNPFSASTSFVVGLPEAGKVTLTIYTRAGERVCRLMTNSQVPMTNMAAGVHIVPWDGTNDNGRHVAPGTYEYVLDYVHGDKTDRIHKRLVLTRQ